MLDFGALPPEVNSARIYAGPGSAPMMAAASAWQALAGQLESAARGYSAVISGLHGEDWLGNASNAMADAVAPYVEWLSVAAAQAEEAAFQARAAAAAYEAAYAETVPPPLVTANRAEYAALVATNIFGQNTTQIAASEAAYAEMWAQDARAMYGYATSSSAATNLTRFGEPPPITNAAAQPLQAAAVAQAGATAAGTHSQNALSELMSTVPQQLQALSTAGSSGDAASTDPWSSLLTAFSNFNTLTGPTSLGNGISRTVTSAGSFGSGLFRASVQSAGASPAAPHVAPSGAVAAGAKTLASEVARGPVLASVGRAAPIGALTVPPSWASATPVASAVEVPQWMSETDLGAVAEGGGAGAAPVAGMGPLAGMAARPTVSSVLRVAPRQFRMPRPAIGG
ncbi:PPE family protein [Mycobacterium shimoidei]|uniref:PPE family protein n=1 Tax=Mycobacterium shimoidei TaxID=29313 RepID=UPI000848861A|nr:PPE family protein [Mycobacterium shimoidei]MCV7259866.1 PPE family protein [Mycobacterium shimoidei]ODR15080.1 hypothetical protein BHQ16_03400 [Mycobacterium shimoidei]ORW79329.1 hypothetical protein AWC26_16815 [Mycobacterium shimoidei]